MINAAIATYDLALDPDNAGRMLITSLLTGEKCNLLGSLWSFAEMPGGGPPLHGLICGGGTTETQKLAIRKNLNLEEKKRLVKKLAGIADIPNMCRQGKA